MPMTYMTPGVYIEEQSGGTRPIQAVGTSTAGFVGVAPRPDAPVNKAVAVNNWSEFARKFMEDEPTVWTDLAHAVFGFFNNGGRRCWVVNIGPDGTLEGGGRREGLSLLEEVDEVAILAAPGYADPGSWGALLDQCERLKDRVAILDPPAEIGDISELTRVAAEAVTRTRRRSGAGSEGEGEASAEEAAPSGPGGARPRQSERGFGAFYFPRIAVRDPLSPTENVVVPPSGHLAGVWARTDAERGVHKAPANTTVRGALNLDYVLTDAEQGELNQAGVNCLRFFSREGILVWGARTVGDPSGEWRYLNVRRLFSMIEESIVTSTRWIVFEPNDRTLWKSIRRDVNAFLLRLWRDGALMGRTPEEAFFVKCDEETNPPDVIDAGQVITVIGVAPVKPAEFIVFQISQTAAGAEVDSEVSAGV